MSNFRAKNTLTKASLNSHGVFSNQIFWHENCTVIDEMPAGKPLILFAFLLCFASPAQAASKLQLCDKTLQEVANFSRLRQDFVGGEFLKLQDKPKREYARIDEFLSNLPPLETETLPKGSEYNANIGADFLLGKIIAGRRYNEDRKDSNYGVSYIGIVTAVKGVKTKKSWDKEKDSVSYEVKVSTASGKIITTLIAPHFFEWRPQYHVNVVRDPEKMDVPELDATQRKVLRDLPHGIFKKREKTGAGKDEVSAEDALASFEKTVGNSGWSKGVPGYALTSPEALEKFLNGKLITYPEFLHNDTLVSIATPEFGNATSARFTSGQIIDAAVKANNVGHFNITSFIVTNRNTYERVDLFYPDRIYWQGIAEPDPFALTKEDLARIKGIDLNPTFIYQKAEGPSTYGSAPILNAFASHSDGSFELQDSIQKEIWRELLKRGARTVLGSIPQESPRTEKKLKKTLTGKMALIIEVDSHNREQAHLKPIIGKIIRAEHFHSSRMTRDDEISVTYFIVTLQTPTGVREVYFDLTDWTLPKRSFVAFEW